MTNTRPLRFAAGEPASPESAFWDWFCRNEEALFLFHVRRDGGKVLDGLSARMRKIHDALVFEFGPIVDGRREFVISAGGVRKAFPAVESLHHAAPRLERWVVVKFRPRRGLMDMRLRDGNVSVRAQEVFWTLHPDGGKPGLALYFRDYRREMENAYLGAAFLMLDQVLGEYDVETKVGEIRVGNWADCVKSERRPLRELAVQFDAIAANGNV